MSSPSPDPDESDPTGDLTVRSFLGEAWVVTIRFYLGLVFAVLGPFLALGGVLLGWEVRVTDGVDAAVPFLGLVTFLSGVFALSGSRVSKRQRQYLSRADREAQELRSYLSFLDEVEDDTEWDRTGLGGGRSDAGSPSLRELRSRFELALENLEASREAVYRGNYATFLSLYYDASRQEILLYDLLDEFREGWTFGLDPGGEADAGSPPATPTAREPHRRRHLAERIRSFAEGTLPENQLALVRTYLGKSDTLPTPWQLYYAVRILHEWNVSQYEGVLGTKRFLRRLTVALLFVLVGLAAVVIWAFPGAGFLGAVNATSSEGTSLPAGSIIIHDSFLVLVVLTGALGAVVSVTRDFDWKGFTNTTDPTVTEPTQMVEGFLARIVFGSVSALFLFVLARSELGAVLLAADLLQSPLALLLITFVAGFSENLILQLLSDIVNRISPRESSDTERGELPERTPPSGGGGPSSTGGGGDARPTDTTPDGDDGSAEDAADGDTDGAADGDTDGAADGDTDGAADGDTEGEEDEGAGPRESS
jgi:hypothetical protein